MKGSVLRTVIDTLCDLHDMECGTTVHITKDWLANDAKQPVEASVPYTVGLWQKPKPVQVALNKGSNTLNFEIKTGSRGVTIKEFALTPTR
mgnify:CR=1 FL=1